MRTSLVIRNILLLVLGFLSLGALFGGLALSFKPDGSLIGVPLEILENTVFGNFLVPGLVLLFTFGIFPIFVMWSLIKKPNIRFCEHLNLIHDHHFSWAFIIYIGIALIIWINVQTLLINAVDIIHTIYSSLGILIVCLALLPSVRVLYRQ